MDVYTKAELIGFQDADKFVCYAEAESLRAQIAELKAENERLDQIRDEHDERGVDIDILAKENDELKRQNAELTKDAERWSKIELLMIVGNVELNQDEDGGYSISVDPVENIMAQSWTGASPEQAIDAAMKGEQQ